MFLYSARPEICAEGQYCQCGEPTEPGQRRELANVFGMNRYGDTGLESLVSGVFSVQRAIGWGQKPDSAQAAPQKQSDTPRGRATAGIQFALPYLKGISGEILLDLRENHRAAFLDFRY